MDKARFGLVGTGNITGWWLAGAREDGRFTADAICSRTRERGNEFAKEHGIGRVFTSLEEMAADSGIDAVYIASPNSEHCRQAIACMERGKAVMCEKPLASNLHEARMMADCARSNNVLLMEAMIATINPNFAELRRRLPELGKLRRYFASYCQYSSRYDRYKQGELPNAFNPELSNGAVMDIGIYTIYPMVALFGAPQSIQASGVKLDSGVDGQGTVTFKYQGMDASVIYSKIANSFLPTEIEGENGNIEADAIHTIRRLTMIPRPVANSGRGGTVKRNDITVALLHDVYYYEVSHFIDLLQSGSKESPVNSLANSLETIRIIDEIRRQLGVAFPADRS